MKHHRINFSSKLYTVFGLGILCTFLLMSCHDFLAEESTTDITAEAYTIQSQADVDAVVSGPYRSLTNWTSGAGDWGNLLPATLEYPTGKATSEAVHPQLWRYETDQVTGDFLQNFNNQWFYWYRGVRDANFAIEMLEAAEGIPEPQILRALGEVRALRAFYYFNIVWYWGDAVMITEPIEGADMAEQPNTSLKTIYDEVIIPDLEFAVNESGLQNTRSSDGRVTRHVARAILADVYLTVAGYPYQEVETNPGADWASGGLWSMDEYPVNSQSAIDFLQRAQEQLNALYGSYSLGTYDHLRDPDMSNQGEAIFQAQFQAGVTNNDLLVEAALPHLSRISNLGSERGSFLATVEYINSYDPDDLRLQDRQMFFYEDTIGSRWDSSEPAAPPFARPYVFKFYDETAIKDTGQSGLNWTFYRYADILLMLTEVNWTLNELGVSVADNDIVKGINEVRDRAQLAGYDASELDLHAIMSERAYELILENKMLWDQRRTRRALVDGDGEFTRLESFFGHQPTNFNYSFSPKHLLSPISGREILTNSQIIQNFDYLPR